MLWAILLGVVCGLICQHLPSDANSFITDSLAAPLMSLVLNLISGVMGPVIFISMTTSIIAFDDIKELTNLGSRIMRRFIVIILFLTAVSFAVSALLFGSFSEWNSDITISFDAVIAMILDVIPTNLVSPFLENSTPQLVVLGILLGSSLLILGDRVRELCAILRQINEWAMNVMKIVLKIIPVIPFISIMSSIAKGNGAEMLAGWRFILAVYLVFTICTAAKAFKASAKTGIGIGEFIKKIRPVVMISLTTGSTAAPIKKAYEISENEFGIKKEFSSFWIPMCSAMLSPKTTVNIVVGAFMVARMTGTPVTLSFIVVLILTLELSIASPGTSSAWAVVLESLAMPTSYVGILTAYRLLTANYSAACTMAYDMFEEVEAAYKYDSISRSDEQWEIRYYRDIRESNLDWTAWWL